MGQRIIGLTGGIATGKSTVSDYLARVHHLPVLDADIYARQAVEPGAAALGAIATRYGSSLLHADGTLNRGKLGEIIFNQPAEKAWLEQQIHPVVRRHFEAAMAKLTEAPVVVQVIPLLFEANLVGQVSEIWVVTCPFERQRQRLMERSGLTAEQATARIHSQMPLVGKVALADVALDNSADLPTLFRQVDEALQHAR
ncbi:dephospho-CoA kinase [Phormidium tenue]|uniref:Dephospho-CoA kinase n=1 Tax=Phormidium tenue NIES-30 TaxID=549789 RepID=A0A1U7IZV8_9CYAN|nr:dephospho-CoA kinase [Phormidium tenue]MBD2231692.1 dephospho-CoA kinase [Phormidium tenue FACHB-1052]OKH44808.1 dephospho-CoA kinase [Phormidium tenue NIES-30]